VVEVFKRLFVTFTAFDMMIPPLIMACRLNYLREVKTSNSDLEKISSMKQAVKEALEATQNAT
jgi:hypothetical protein